MWEKLARVGFGNKLGIWEPENMRKGAAMRYSTGAIILHWLIAVLIALNFAAAWVAEDLPKPEQMQVMANHKAIGITVLLLTLVRIGWRLMHVAPPLSPHLKTWEAGLAKAVYGLLYLVMLALPVTGWGMHLTGSGGKPVNVFGVFAYPGLPVAHDKALSDVFHEMHGLFATLMLALLFLHVAGALKHQFIDRDGEMRRMWFGRGQ